MELSDRIGWLIFGMIIGFVLGYIVARLREIEEKVATVDEHVIEAQHKDERGAMSLANAMLLIVVLVVAFSAFASQRASNNVKENQENIVTVAVCNQEFLAKILVAVNERTSANADQLKSNVALQRSQSQFLTILLADPPETEAAQKEALRRYFDDLNDFIEVNGETMRAARENPYPTVEEYMDCLGPM